MRPINTPTDEKCKSCKFWDDYGDSIFAKPREGACCRYPPVRNGNPESDAIPMHQLFSYPVTGEHWWCGEFKAADA